MKDDSRDWLPGGGPDLGTYILTAEHNALKVDTLTWAIWLEVEARKPYGKSLKNLWLTEIPGYGRVSTVFMGLDHSFGMGPPLLFETMSFNTYRRKRVPSDLQARCSTWQQAMEQHVSSVALLRQHGKELHRLRSAGDKESMRRLYATLP